MFHCVQFCPICSPPCNWIFCFCFVFCFFTSREGWEDTSAKKQLTGRFLSYNPPREKKKKNTKTQRLRTQTESHTEIKACLKETDLSRLTQVQMSQCGWISFGILSAPSFKKGAGFFFCHRDKMRELAPNLGRHGNIVGVREHRWTHLVVRHTWSNKGNGEGAQWTTQVVLISAGIQADKYLVLRSELHLHINSV